jgi:hypothetical protein
VYFVICQTVVGATGTPNREEHQMSKSQIMDQSWSYDEWIAEQAEHVASATNRFAMGGISNAAVYVMPSNGAKQGELIVALEQPDGCSDVLTFTGHGTSVCWVPRSQLKTALWHACRRVPICPTI